ncbi:maleylpyruvate isomerase family mycothiol-dependent enzyme [Nocardiopsis sp. JB363]|uniref:maleylpyruvate isomerase family mycothiol-dependent enzyme n=1 Tax=Nocardiopsis sp. JB363 TaxID=1434837 RepID=UPI001F3946BB|nr:maleylpyruvate isomerase family mycothiol-dependent enzyme [Nocardiopsis sp. JB363]
MTSPSVPRKSQADLWPLIHRERTVLAEDLAGITEERWATPSLCSDFSVREVLAHLTASASLTGFQWFAGVVRCRFDFDAQVAMRLAEHLGDSGAGTLARFRSAVDSTTSPPLPRLAILGEVIVHGEDIRRPLGLANERPVDLLTRVAEYYRGTDQVVVAKSRVRDLRLRATDGPFLVGDGPEVRGPPTAPSW